MSRAPYAPDDPRRVFLPDDGVVRAVWVDHYTVWYANMDPDEIGPEFDQWLSIHDSKVAARTLREFADTRGVNVGDEDSEWWTGYRAAQRECLHAAVARADEIEAAE